jgi:hypothetical protein
MLHKCANPACPNLFRSLSRGKLFLLHMDGGVAGASRVASANPSANRRERPAGQMERFWLCDGCSPLLTLTFERGRGMVTVPLPTRNTAASALHLGVVRPVRPAVEAYRAELKGAL